MTSQMLWISGTFPGMNEIIRAAKTKLRSSKRNWKKAAYLYTVMKDHHRERVFWAATAQGIRPVKKAFFKLTWIEPDKRRDKDNIAAAKKFIFDGLVDAQVLESDGWEHVVGWENEFKVDREEPGVRVEIIEQ